MCEDLALILATVLEEMMAYGYERFLLKLADQVEADNRGINDGITVEPLTRQGLFLASHVIGGARYHSARW